jgi:hypothetical protein
MIPLTVPARRLTLSEEAKVIQLRDCQLERSQIVAVLQRESNHYIHPKDVSNILTSHKAMAKAEGLNQTRHLLEAAKESNGWSVDVSFDETSHSIPCAYFLHHVSMKKNFAEYHDILLLDETYKVSSTIGNTSHIIFIPSYYCR